VTSHVLAAERLHYAWDNALEPVLIVDPGDGVTFATWDANAHYYTPHSTSEDAARKPPFKGHALTGPVFVQGAGRGDTLVVDVLEVVPANWGFTAFYPGRGLLPDDFSSAYLRGWDLESGFGLGVPGVKVPLAPFCGIMGAVLRDHGRRPGRAWAAQHDAAAARGRQHGRETADGRLSALPAH
jgi:acetamidase/formamidase